MNKSLKTTYFSNFHNTKSANIFNFSLSSFNFNFWAIISSIEFQSERSRVQNFRSFFDLSKNRADFFSSISILIMVEWVNFRVIRAKFRAIQWLVSTLRWSLLLQLLVTSWSWFRHQYSQIFSHYHLTAITINQVTKILKPYV